MTTTAPIPRPPAVDQQRQVTQALGHRLATQRSSQALDTALMELRDADLAARALCPITTDPADGELRAHAARLRLNVAIIHAVAAGASSHQISEATGGRA